MSSRDEVQRLAQAHVDWFSHKAPAPELGVWVEQYWAPDVGIYNKGGVAPTPADRWRKAHSAENGYSWDNPDLKFKDVVVGDDTFVIQVTLKPRTQVASDAIPICLVCKVADGMVVRVDQYWSLGPGGVQTRQANQQAEAATTA